jgi:hypothetical protein
MHYDFDFTVAALRDVAPNLGGFVERSNLGARTIRGEEVREFTITLRVPVDEFEIALRQIETLAQVVGATQQAQDITAQFYDMASRLETRRIEEERILMLIDQTERLNELLDLERRLGQVRLQIERYEGQLYNMAQRSAFSTINVMLREVLEAAEEIVEEEEIILIVTLGDRIGSAFGGSVDGTSRFFQEMLIFLAAAIIPLTAIGLVVFAGIKMARFSSRRGKVA